MNAKQWYQRSPKFIAFLNLPSIPRDKFSFTYNLINPNFLPTNPNFLTNFFNYFFARFLCVLVQQMMAEAEVICCQKNMTMTMPVLDVKYNLCVASQEHRSIDVSSPSSSIMREIRVAESVSTDRFCVKPVASCSDTVKAGVIASSIKFVPTIRSGSYSDIGPRKSMDDEHICIDDLSAKLGSPHKIPVPSAFYGVFDGHGGPEAAAYVKRNAMRLFFEDVQIPQASDIDDLFLEELENSHRRAFLQADLAMADEGSISSSCGTTALTALVLGRHLLVANAGDCRAVLCRKGVAVEMSQDHRPSYLPERKRVEELGGYIDDGYLNGYLSVTRGLGDWEMKLPLGSASPLTAEPDVQQVLLTEDDEFLIICCDGIWDVMSSQYAVSLVRRALRRHNDPHQCARELVTDALRLNSYDNLTAIVICFNSPNSVESCPPRRKLRCFNLSEEAQNRLKSLLEGN